MVLLKAATLFLVLCWNHYILSQRFESYAVWLLHCDGQMTGFTQVYITNNTRFSFMRSANDMA